MAGAFEQLIQNVCGWNGLEESGGCVGDSFEDVDGMGTKNQRPERSGIRNSVD